MRRDAGVVERGGFENHRKLSILLFLLDIFVFITFQLVSNKVV